MFQKYKSFLILLSVIYFLLCLYKLFKVFVFQISDGFLAYFFLGCASFIIIKKTNSIEWLKDLRLKATNQDNSFFFKRVISFLIAGLLILIRLILVAYYNKNGIGYNQYYLKDIIILTLSVSVCFEEIYFKCGIYRFLKLIGINEIGNFIICSLLFSILHLIGIFYSFASFLSVIIVTLLYQIMSLIIFKLNPSLLGIIIFHFIFDFTVLL